MGSLSCIMIFKKADKYKILSYYESHKSQKEISRLFLLVIDDADNDIPRAKKVNELDF